MGRKGARAVLRQGNITDAEKDMVIKFVQDQPREMTTTQVNALSRVLRRTKETTLKLIEEARETLVDSSKRYVEVHLQAAEQALANGDPKSLEVAMKASQWAMENISGEGGRIVDKKTADVGNTGNKIFIGVRIGGVREDAPLEAEVVSENK